MLDPNTFLTILYVLVDDFCKSQVPPPRQPGRPPALSDSEVITLLGFSQWRRFGRARDFYRYAETQLRDAFPRLPNRSQFNRHARRCYALQAAFWRYQSDLLQEPEGLYQALDSTAVPTRAAKRRGKGWLPGPADIGYSNRLGGYAGLHLLLATGPAGNITGFSLAPASAKDQTMTEVFLAFRLYPHPRLPTLGAYCPWYVADKGFTGRAAHQRWQQEYQACVVAPPQRHRKHPWRYSWRRWVAGKRQIGETDFAQLQGFFRLGQDRPHTLEGLQTRLVAKVIMHNFCIGLNRQLGRPNLSFADLLGW